MAKAAPQATKDRLLAAAASLFAERGFHATSVREIAERAGTNVASGNYHYGSKKALYLEVLREQFQNIRAELRKSGGAPAPAELSRLSKRELTKVLHLRLLTMLKLTLGPPPGLHGALMQREMCDPSEALPVIVAEFIVPTTEEMGEILSHLFPSLPPLDVERCVLSMVGQAIFYRFTMPAVLHIQKLDEYPPEMAGELAEHIAEFSLAGAKHLAERGKRGRRAR
jgi:AcrR family transcriptional regulator